MGETLRLIAVSVLECSYDLLTYRFLFHDKLSQQIAVQALVSCHSLEAIHNVHTLNCREDNFIPYTHSLSWRISKPRLDWSGPPRKCGKERFGIDGLGHVVVHSRFQAALDLIGHHVSRHGDNRKFLQLRLGAQKSRCGKT